MRKGKKETSPFVKLDYDLLDSAAYTALSLEACWVYTELKKQFKYPQGGNDHLVLPYSKVLWRMSRQTFAKAIRALESYGFIRIVQKGGLYKRPNVYALSEGWKRRSIGIVDKEGKQAILNGLVEKRRFRGMLNVQIKNKDRSIP